MMKKERQKLQKVPAKEVRVMYAKLIDELRAKRYGVNVESQIYNIGWHDGYNAAKIHAWNRTRVAPL